MVGKVACAGRNWRKRVLRVKLMLQRFKLAGQGHIPHSALGETIRTASGQNPTLGTRGYAKQGGNPWSRMRPRAAAMRPRRRSGTIGRSPKADTTPTVDRAAYDLAKAKDYTLDGVNGFRQLKFAGALITLAVCRGAFNIMMNLANASWRSEARSGR